MIPTESPGNTTSTEDDALEIEKALNEILRISLIPISLHSQLYRILDLIAHLPWLALESKGCIFLVEGDPPELAMKAQVGMPEAVLISCQKVRFGSCLCGGAILADKPIFADRIDDRHEIQHEGISPHGHYCVPITSGERRVGVLMMYVREGHPFSPVEDGFLRSAAGVIAGIIERKEVEEALRRSEERFALAVRGIDAGIWDWDLRTGTVYYSPRWKAMLGFNETEITGHYLEWETRIHPDDRVWALDAHRDYREGRTEEFKLEHRLRHKDGTYRWIYSRAALERDQEGRPYRMVGSDQDVTERKQVERKLGQREASLIAARRIMEHLLPAGPLDTRELSIRGACYAADHASGDYFNYFPLADGSIIVVIADVTGHGIEAALLVTVIHGCLRACIGLSLGLEETIKRLNAVLFDETEGDSCVTLIAVRIDPRSRSLVYTNAGHPAALLLDRSGKSRAYLESLTVPLGILPTAEFPMFPIAGPLTLGAEDLVLLYTDGVIEARGADHSQFGLDRLHTTVHEQLDSPLEVILDHVHRKIREFRVTEELQDDETIVLIKVP
jgi:PAS domain S-box-containing protein